MVDKRWRAGLGRPARGPPSCCRCQPGRRQLRNATYDSHVRPPARLLPRVLLAATAGFALVVALWSWLWFQLGAAMGDVRHQLTRVEVWLYLLTCPGLSVVAPLLAWRAPHVAGSALVFGGLFAAWCIWRWHIPAYGGREALWCMPMAMVSLGSGWLATPPVVRRER